VTTDIHLDYLSEQLGPQGHPTSFQLRCPDHFNFAYDVVDRLASLSPERRALRWSDDQGGRADYSFADLAELSDRAASFLSDLGIGPGDRVMLALRRQAEFWWVILGLHKIGAVAAPATHLLKAEDLVYRFEQAEVAAVLATSQGGLADEIDQACAQLRRPPLKLSSPGQRPGWIDFAAGLAAAGPWDRPRQAPSLTDPMLLYFTSGTTGAPKMVTHDFSYPIAHLPTAKYWQKVESDSLHLTVSDTGWGKAVWGKLYGQWLMEACVDVYDFDHFDPAGLLDHLVEAEVTSFCAAPTVYRFLIGCDLAAWDLSRLRHCSIAGEAMNPVVYETFRQRTGLELKEAFGQTETTAVVMTPHWLETKAGSMGQPSPAYQVALLTPDGSEAEPGQEGEICLRTDAGRPLGLFAGYLGDPELTAQVWHDGYYHTRDLAVQDKDGYLWYVGRVDDMIKTSGYRVSPFEVESVLLRHPAVRECAVTGVYDELRGLAIKATIVPHDGFSPTDELARQIQSFVKQRTAPYKYPRQVEFVTALPMTVSGKVRRAEIRRRDEALTAV
jgi:acetyl-CoA synthetase